MYRVPEYFHAMSLRLSEVLDGIGVNQKIVFRRRRSHFRLEVIQTFCYTDPDISAYYFGSQVEGTTTLGLHSDADQLCCHNCFNVIQNWSEWRHDKLNLLMIQDENTAPGYCRLQVLRADAPLPVETALINNNITFDISGRVLIKNTLIRNEINNNVPAVKGPSLVVKDSNNVNYSINGNNCINIHGPAYTESKDGCRDCDTVLAFRCKTWRHFERPYVRHRQQQMLHEDEENGCFIVPVGHRQSDNETSEWRISPSLQERNLMFRMNITHIRCYVVLKMIVKHYINPFIPNCISSFHCKTTLFWCKETTREVFWRDHNLLTCIMFCLNRLLLWIYTNNCPHYLIPQENLFAGKLNPNNRRPLIRIVKNILLSNGRFLHGIPFDQIGQRLQFKCTMDSEHVLNVYPSYAVCMATAAEVALCECVVLGNLLYFFLDQITSSGDDVTARIRNTLDTLTSIQEQNNLQQEATNNLLQFLYTTLGSLMSSLSLYQGNGLPRQAFYNFMRGLDSDVASSRLKLASVLYCSGDLYNADVVLQDIEQRYDTDYVMPVCGCYNSSVVIKSRFVKEIVRESNDQYTRYTAFCVLFLREEMFCVPHALQFEMFRSTGNDVRHRSVIDVWMDWFVVDSLPFLYYLQYMTYRQMGRREDQNRALDNLHWSIDHEVNLSHRETGWNILGKCMELEDRVEGAFYCYGRSLGIRPRNNAANWHIACLTFRLVQNNQRIT